MDNEDGVDSMTDLIANSLEGNVLSVQDTVNAILSQKALDALSAMKVDVAQSIYGNYGSESQESEMDAGVEYPEDDTENELEGEAEEESEWEIPEDDDFGTDDSELDDLFNELEDLTDFEETDTDSDNEQEETPDE